MVNRRRIEMTVELARLEALERRTTRLEAQMAALGAAAPPAPAPAPVAPERPAPLRAANVAAHGEAALRRPAPRADRTAVKNGTPPRAAAVTARSLEDLLGGRVLGWLGAVTVLLGLAFFLALASARGWIGPEARVALAAAASLALLLAGARGYERGRRLEVALAAAATGIAGLFATLVVAGPVHGLLPAVPATVLGLLVGAAATVLALRWQARGIAWLGLIGALASPLLVGAAGSGAGVALMLAAYAGVVAVGVWQRWHGLAFAGFAVAGLQLGDWLLGAGRPLPVIAALVAFGAATVVSAAGAELRTRSRELRVSAEVLLAANALVLAGLGVYGLYETAGPGAENAWLAGLALAHLALGIATRRLSRPFALTAGVLGVMLGDVALATLLDGLPLALTWTASALGFAGLARATGARGEIHAARAGLGAHLLLALTTTIAGAGPLGHLAGSGDATLLTGLAAIAATAWAAARLTEPRLELQRMLLDALALAALAGCAAVALEGVALCAALAGEAVALALVARRTEDVVADHGALALLGTAGVYALATLTPPAALADGLADPAAAVLGLGAVIAATLVAAWAGGRVALGAGAAVLALHLASAALVTPFQPDGTVTGLPLAELDVRQQGQMLLSALWALVGAAALVAGLARDLRPLRLAGLALLGLATGKVFLADLAMLDELYRVGSFVALGLLLLAGGYAWQRLRPRALPDLREVS